MKKSLLLFTILLFSALACLAQNNESLGDKAMEQGNYEKAVEYYMAEMSKNPTDALVRKLNKAVILKYEFSSIDNAVGHDNYREMDLHIANVLMNDPNNRFVENQRSSTAQFMVTDKKDFFSSVFLCNKKKLDVFGSISFEQGVNLLAYPGQNDSIRGVTSAQRLYLRLSPFPLTLEVNNQLALSKSNPHRMWGFGIGSNFYIGNHISVDYGLGFQRNRFGFNDMRRDLGLYYRAGITVMGNRKLGIGYSFNHYSNRNEPSFNSHQITLVASVGGYGNYDDMGGGYVATAFHAWHQIAALIILIGMLKRY